MKKSAKIYIVMLIWVSVVIQLFVNEKVEAGQGIAEAFYQTDVMEYDSRLEMTGVYGNENYSDRKVRNILSNIISEVSENQETCYIYRNSTNDIWQASISNNEYELVVSFIRGANKERSYLNMTVTIDGTESCSAKNNRQPIDIWKEKLDKIYKSLGIEAETKIIMKGSLQGKMNNARKAVCQKNIEKTFDDDSIMFVYKYNAGLDVTNIEVNVNE